MSQQKAESAWDVAREMLGEEDPTRYIQVPYTSKKTGKTTVYEVRPPTIQEDADASMRALRMETGPDGRPLFKGIDPAAKLVNQLITSVYAEKDGRMVPVWSWADRDTLLRTRRGKGSLVDTLLEAIDKAMEPPSLEVEKGNSDASPRDATR